MQQVKDMGHGFGQMWVPGSALTLLLCDIEDDFFQPQFPHPKNGNGHRGCSVLGLTVSKTQRTLLLCSGMLVLGDTAHTQGNFK